MFNDVFDKVSLNMVEAMKAAVDSSKQEVDLHSELQQLKARLEKCEQALDKEVWNSKLGKFMKFRDMPEVVKVLQDEQT